MPKLEQKFCSTLLNNSVARAILNKRALYTSCKLQLRKFWGHFSPTCTQIYASMFTCSCQRLHFPTLRQNLLSWCSSLRRESQVLETLRRRPFSSSVIPGCVKPFLKTPDTNKARPAARHEEARNIQNLLIKENNKYFALSMQIRLETKLRVDSSKPTRKSSWLQQWKSKGLNPLFRYVSALFK